MKTRQWLGPDVAAGLPPPPRNWGGDIGASYGLYNPTLDEFVRLYTFPMMQRLNLTAGTWTE